MTVISELVITEDDIQRFYSRIAIQPNGCYLWTEPKKEGGYGQITINGQSCQAHRISYFLSRGFIIDELHVLHNCPDGDDPGCVAPNHLWQGTNKENMEDMITKGHNKRLSHEQHPMAKMTEEDVLLLRSEHCRFTHTQLAEMFKISRRQVRRLIMGTSWKPIDREGVIIT